ncbi:hypothetical protein MMC28_008308 [Mycoblastus sanguinarius]|nr:hypothetical protein [Mycoblastus sanguinarius]
MKTISYSQVDSLDIRLDLYVPASSNGKTLPGLVFFHGGGMTAGARKDFLVEERKDSTLAKGIIFISADYRLLHPSTGSDIIDDMKQLFAFISAPRFSHDHLPEGVVLDGARIAVVGASGGGYPAYVAGLYAIPKPKAICIYYGMGGQLLSDH